MTTSGNLSSWGACQSLGASRWPGRRFWRFISRYSSVSKCSCSNFPRIFTFWIAPSRIFGSSSRNMMSSMPTEPTQNKSRRLNNSDSMSGGTSRPCSVIPSMNSCRSIRPSPAGDSTTANISPGLPKVSVSQFRKRRTSAPSTGASSSSVISLGESSPNRAGASTEMRNFLHALQNSRKFTSSDPSGSSSTRQPRRKLPPPASVSAATTFCRSASTIRGPPPQRRARGRARGR
mmetsp:Transcript_95972/g.293558  ORF Transcript_95972/g.293558 Transcript_95972/m.293558 type:complete len:233 (+) Transcript_95972:360-1058(+)